MNTAKHIGRIGALAVALGITAAVTAAPASSSQVPAPHKTALMLGGTSIPTWRDADVEVIMNQFIAPTHRCQTVEPCPTIEPVAVTTPVEGWPATGAIRFAGSLLGPPSIFAPGGAAWPDEPWWKLTGLFDLTYDQSTRAGIADLERAMADYGSDDLVIYGYSHGAIIANREKQRLAEQYPDTRTAPNIDFVLSGDPNLPNGGLLARFPGLYVPIGWTFDGPEPTNTPFDTVVITRQYDLLSDFPLYPLNVVSLANAALGGVYVHLYPFDVSLAPDATTPHIKTEYGDTDYYFFETKDLPLFGPLRTLGVPERVIDVFEPFVRVIVEQGYDRSIPLGQPTPARLIRTNFDSVKVATDLVNAIGEGIDNAGALVEPKTLMKTSAARTDDDTDEVVVDAQLQTNDSVGAMESVENGRTGARSFGRTDHSTRLDADRPRQTPLRDAVRNLSGGIKKAVADISSTVKKALRAGKHEAATSAGQARQSPDTVDPD